MASCPRIVLEDVLLGVCPCLQPFTMNGLDLKAVIPAFHGSCVGWVEQRETQH